MGNGVAEDRGKGWGRLDLEWEAGGADDAEEEGGDGDGADADTGVYCQSSALIHLWDPQYGCSGTDLHPSI